MFVRTNDTTSDVRSLSQGVPQGCRLSQTLWNLFMADFPLSPPSVILRLYADDIQFSTTKDNQKESQAELQKFANQILLWTKTWLLRLSVRLVLKLRITVRPVEEFVSL